MRKIAYAALLVVILSCGAYGGNIIVNGGFETTYLDGWTYNPQQWFTNFANVHSGNWNADTTCAWPQCLSLGNPQTAYLYQDVPTTPGQTYTLSFFWSPGPLSGSPSSSELKVLWGDPTQPSLTTVVDLLTSTGTLAYSQYVGTVTATSATSRIEFLGRQDAAALYLDDVSLEESSIPEPGSFSLLVLAPFAIAVSRRFRKSPAPGLRQSRT